MNTMGSVAARLSIVATEEEVGERRREEEEASICVCYNLLFPKDWWRWMGDLDVWRLRCWCLRLFSLFLVFHFPKVTDLSFVLFLFLFLSLSRENDGTIKEKILDIGKFLCLLCSDLCLKNSLIVPTYSYLTKTPQKQRRTAYRIPLINV